MGVKNRVKINIIKTSLAGLALLVGLGLAASVSAAEVEVANGKVTDIDTSLPLQGVTVECHTPNGNVTGSGVTNASGDYSCKMDDAQLQSGVTTIVVENRAFDGYRSDEGQNFTWNGSAQTFNFELTPTTKTINVTVKNTNGQDVQADVIAQPIALAPGELATQSSTNVTGSGSIGVTGGKWIVTADRNLSEQNPETYPWVGVGGAQEVEFAADNSVETISLNFEVVPSQTKVAVKMVDADGAILTGNDFNGDILFEGYNKNYGSLSTHAKVSGATGIAQLYLLPGVWKISGHHPQLNGQSFNPEDVRFVLPDEPGSVDWGTVQAVENNGTLSGSLDILNDSGNNNVQITATNLDSGNRFQANSSVSAVQASGSFTIQNLEVGEYSLTVDQSGFIATQTAAAVITESQNKVSGLVIEAKRLDQTISGNVVDGAGNPLADFPGTVTVIDQAGLQFSAPVKPDGSYSVQVFTQDLTGDTLTVMLVTQPGASAYQVDEIIVSVKENGTTNQNIETATTEGTISGSLKDLDNGATLTDSEFGDLAEVMAVNVNTGSVEKTEVEDNGSFEMEVGPGEWKLVPKINDIDATVYASGVSNDTVSVSAGESVVEPLELLTDDGMVSGTITDPDGNEAKEAPILVTNLPALEAEALANSTQVDPSEIVSEVVTTNANGVFEMNLPAGDYVATFGTNPDLDDNVEPIAQEFTVTDGGTAMVDAAYRSATSTLTGSIGSGFEVGTVTAYSTDGGTETVNVDEAGTYTMNVNPGSWSMVTTGVKDGALYIDQQTVTVATGENTVDPTLNNTGVEFPAAVTKTGQADEPLVITNIDGASFNLPAYSADYSGEITATLQPVPEFSNSGDISQVGLSYEVSVLDADGIPVKSLNRPATVTLPIDEELSTDVDKDEMTAAYHNDDLESYLYDGMVADTNGDTMVIQTDHLSRFAVTTNGEVDMGAVSKPTKPRTLKTKNVKKTSAVLTWKAPQSSSVSKYKVHVRQCKNDTAKQCRKNKQYQKAKQWKKYNNVSAQENRSVKRKPVKKLESNTFYQFRVRAVNSVGQGSWSDWKRFRTKS